MLPTKLTIAGTARYLKTPPAQKSPMSTRTHGGLAAGTSLKTSQNGSTALFFLKKEAEWRADRGVFLSGDAGLTPRSGRAALRAGYSGRTLRHRRSPPTRTRTHRRTDAHTHTQTQRDMHTHIHMHIRHTHTHTRREQPERIVPSELTQRREAGCGGSRAHCIRVYSVLLAATWTQIVACGVARKGGVSQRGKGVGAIVAVRCCRTVVQDSERRALKGRRKDGENTAKGQ